MAGGDDAADRGELVLVPGAVDEHEPGGEAGAGPHVGSSPALGRDVGGQLRGQDHVQGSVVRRVQVRELRELGDQERLLVRGALAQREARGRRAPRCGTGPTSTPDSCRTSSKESLLEVRGRVLGLLLLGDRPAHVGPRAPPRRGARRRGAWPTWPRCAGQPGSRLGGRRSSGGGRSSRPARGPSPPSAGGPRVDAARRRVRRTRPAGSPRSGRGAHAG